MTNELKEYCRESYNIKTKTVIALIAVAILLFAITAMAYWAI